MKYATLIHYSILEQLTYRVSFLLWRIRSTMSLLLVFFLWSAVYRTSTTAFGYTSSEMLTYIMLSTIIATLVLTTRTSSIAGDIVRGTIVAHLLRPMPFFRFLLTKEIADKLLNLVMVTIEVAILLLIMKPVFYIQPQLLTYPALVLGVSLGILIGFFLSLFVSFVAFWSAEVWAPRFIFTVLILFFAGSYFPLDILPAPLYALMLATPFPYLYYAPTKLYLTGITPETVFMLCMGGLWATVLFFAARGVWRKGMREFSFYGA